MRFLYLLALVYALSACGAADKPQGEQTKDEHAHHDHDHNHDGHDHSHEGHKHAAEGDGVHFGATITPDGAISVADILSKVASGEGANDLDLGDDDVVKAIPAKVEGKVSAVCQTAGCWLDMATEDGQTMRILTNHEFTVKPDIVGKTVVVEGNAYESVTSVAERKHLAEDAGKSAEEIAQITEPKSEYKFLAKGLVIK